MYGFNLSKKLQQFYNNNQPSPALLHKNCYLIVFSSQELLAGLTTIFIKLYATVVLLKPQLVINRVIITRICLKLWHVIILSQNLIRT